MRKNPFKGVGYSLIEEPKKTYKKLVTPNVRQNHVFGEQKPLIATKFCLWSDVQDLITHANFGEDRLKGFGVARGRILAFFTDLLSRL